MSTHPSTWGVALVGAGGFGAFLAGTVATVPAIRLRSVVDADPQAARRVAESTGAAVAEDLEGVLADPDVDAVIIATPPNTHAMLAEQALLTGRHVLVEKPFATTPDDALNLERAATNAAGAGTVLVVDHVLRYNPLLDLLAAISQVAGFGPVQRVAIENDASDEDLDTDHWFWDDKVSGGIFVEHGVHFFAACDALVGEQPESVQAIELRRHHDGHVDRALATVSYPGGALATHLHAFTHARRCERQWWRVDLGTAQVVVQGWIPIRLRLDGWTDDGGVEALAALDSPVSISMDVEQNAASSAARAEGVERHLPHRVRLSADLGGPAAKSAAYQACVRAALTDLRDCARTGRTPTASAAEGRSVTTTALAAREAARTGRTIPIQRGHPS